MKTLNDLKDGDDLWVRIMHRDARLTKEVRKIRVKHVLQDDDEVSKMTGFRQSWMRYIEFDKAPHIHYRTQEGNRTVHSSFGVDKIIMMYFTEKSELIKELEDEKRDFNKKIDSFICQLG